MTDLASHESPAPRGADRFAPLSPGLSPAVAAWTRELRTVWSAADMSINRFAGRYPVDKGTLSRYLNGKRVPRDQWFLNTLLAVLAEQGRAVSQPVRDHLIGLQLEALQVAHPHEYKVRRVSDELELAHVGWQEAQRYARSLEEQLADRIRQIEELTDQNGQLRAAWDADRVTVEAEKHRLEQEISDLNRQLQQACQRSAQAEERCEQLEKALHYLDASRYSDSETTESPRSDADHGDLADSLRGIPLNNAGGVAAMLNALRQMGARLQALALAEQAVTVVTVTNANDVMRLLSELKELDSDLVLELAGRAVSVVDVTTAYSVTRMLGELRELSAHGLARKLAERATPLVSVSNAYDVRRLLEELQKLGTEGLVSWLAERAVLAVDVTDGHAGMLLSQLREMGVDHLAKKLAERAAPVMEIAGATELVVMLRELRMLGVEGLAVGLAKRCVPVVDNSGKGVARVIKELRALRLNELAVRFAAQAIPVADISDPYEAGQLLDELRELGAGEFVDRLARRAVDEVNVTDSGVGILLRALRELDRDLALKLAERAVSSGKVTEALPVVILLYELRDLGADGLAMKLAERAVPAIEITDSSDAVRIMDRLGAMNRNDLALEFATRAAPAVDISDTDGVERLRAQLRGLGAAELARKLADRLQAGVGSTNLS
ncbi:hypothetical protein [Actinomadura sp. NTSP31]|uniref:hypothetical protein n=1 Tax=Actinomadura sp. NTSP31 TaxID=1735447 RepID=UPI0035BFFCFC